MNPPVGTAFMSPGPSIDPRQLEEETGLDVGTEPGAGLGGYPGMDGDIRIISREIYQGKTFDDWDDMEANVRRLARKAGFKVVKVSKNVDDSLWQLVAVGVCCPMRVGCPSGPCPPPGRRLRFEQKTTFFVLSRNDMCDFDFFLLRIRQLHSVRLSGRRPGHVAVSAQRRIYGFFIQPQIGNENEELIRSWQAWSSQARLISSFVVRENTRYDAFSVCWLLWQTVDLLLHCKSRSTTAAVRPSSSQKWYRGNFILIERA